MKLLTRIHKYEGRTFYFFPNLNFLPVPDEPPKFPAYINAEFEVPVYDPQAVAQIRDVLRERFPYIDEAADAEVIEFAARFVSGDLL